MVRWWELRRFWAAALVLLAANAVPPALAQDEDATVPNLDYGLTAMQKYCTGLQEPYDCPEKTPQSGHAKDVWRVGPVTRAFMKGASGLGVKGFAEDLLRGDDIKNFNYVNKYAFSYASGALVAIALLALLVGCFQIPACCSAGYRKFLSYFCCGCACRDRSRVKPIYEIPQRRRSRIFTLTVVLICLFLIFDLLALAFSIKFRWSSRGAVCQVGRVSRELSKQIVNFEGRASWWLPIDDSAGYEREVPAGTCPSGRRLLAPEAVTAEATAAEAAGGGGSLVAGGLASGSAASDGSAPPRRLEIALSEFRAKVAEAFGSVVEQALKELEDNSKLYKRLIDLGFIPLVVISAVPLFPIFWVIGIADRLRRHVRRKTEPSFGSYMRQFAFLWWWFCISGALLAIFGVAIVFPVGFVTSLCDLLQKIASDHTLAANYPLTKPLAATDVVTQTVFEVCVEGNTESQEWQHLLLTVPEDAIAAEQWCRAQVISLAAAVDGACEGVTGDLFWVGFGWAFAGVISYILYVVAFKHFHYFKQRDIEKEPVVERSASTLMAEAMCGHCDEVNRLCRDIDAKNVREERFANTTLHYAAYSGDTATVDRLLDAGCQVDERNRHGYTPLGVAAGEGHPQVVATLMSRGADPVVRDKFGETPLHAAARAGNLAVVEALCVDVAPDPVYLNDEDEAAVDTAARYERHDVEQFLDSKTPRGLRKTQPRFDPTSPSGALGAATVPEAE